MRFIALYLFLLMMLVFAPAKAQDYVSRYSPVTIKKMADLIWKYNVHGTSNSDVYANYFQMTNCPLYTKYYQNDFIWQTIVDGFKRDIRYFSHEIPNKFSIRVSVALDRYDFKRSAFLISPVSAMENAGSIQIPFYENKKIACNREILDTSFFPLNIKFIADRKFSLTEIPMNVDQANQLLSGIRKYRYENSESDRIVTLRFLITVNGLQSFNRRRSYSNIIYKGSLDELAFFEDPKMTKLIWKKQFRRFTE